MKIYQRRKIERINMFNKIVVPSWWKIKGSVCNACERHHDWKFERTDNVTIE